MTRLPRLLAAAAILTAVAPLTARAQAAIDAGSTDSVAAVAAAPVAELQTAQLPAGPTLASASVALRAGAEHPVVVVRSSATESAVPNALPAARANRNSSTTLMIVGGAAFVAGAIIGDTAGTLFMVGGAAVGLYGLYQYLQ